jgi:predicted DNA-binding antitoxin AbrB/MazE fold protein
MELNMETIISAVYENGIFKPLNKVNLSEQTKVKLIVRPEKKYVADQMMGMYRIEDANQIDEIITDEDWL